MPKVLGVRIALDEYGLEQTSKQFTETLYNSIEKGGATVTFAIGAAEGLPKEIKFCSENSKQLSISLSKMTWTHQMARLLLMEQIYRATEIKKVGRFGHCTGLEWNRLD